MPRLTKKPLTDAACKRAKPQRTTYALPDSQVRGLRLRISPSGTKTWTLRYSFEGKERQITMGAFPTWKLAKARGEAETLRANLFDGKDPLSERRHASEAMTMLDLFGRKNDEGWFLGTYVRTAGKLGTAKTKASIRSDRSNVGHIRKQRSLMAKRVADVALADLNRLKTKLEDRPGSWRKCRNILRTAFLHAEAENEIPFGSSPVRRATVSPEQKIQRFLTPAQRKKLDQELIRAEKIGPRRDGSLSAHIVLFIRLLLLTGMRVSEVRRMRWEWVDWQHKHVAFPTSKSGVTKDTPLTDQCITFLKGIEGSTARIGLVCATRNNTPMGGENLGRAFRSIRERVGIPNIRVHDLRHSWASDAISNGVPLVIIGKVLGHADPRTTQRYAHLHNHAIRSGLEAAGNAIELATKQGRGR